MALPGWAPSAGGWVTPLPGWQRPEADPEAVNAELQSRAIRVRMGDFEATTARLRGGEGRVTLGDWTGVWTGAPDTTETTDHPRGDGQVAFRERTGARSIELSGLIRARLDRAGSQELRELIATIKRSTRSGVLLLEEHDIGMMREADVRRTDFIATPVSNALATYSLRFVADDPLLYGQGQSVLPRGVATSVRNAGDAARCYPILEWTGAATNPGVDFGRLSWRLGEKTSAGDQMLVDCRNGDVFKNGARIFPNWTGYWPYITGGSTWDFTAVGASMTMRRRSAWS